jgi:GH18 family chitinase
MIKIAIITLLTLLITACSSNWQVKTTRTQAAIQLEMDAPSTFVATVSDYQTNSVAPNSVMIGYLIDGYKPTDAQFKKMTHVAISFLRASDSTGEVIMTSGWENLDEVVAAAHVNNVKAIISFGGGEFKVTSGLMGVKANRQNLIKNILGFMKKHNFDGFDCDWEPSWVDDKVEMEAINNAITHHYITFIKEFREALDAEFGKGNRIFTAAILNGNSIWYSAQKQIAHFPKNGWWNYLDWVALMNYDNDLGSKHATFESVFGAKGSVAYWTKFGIPQAKIVTGVPYYARAGWGAEWLFYKNIVEMNPSIADTVDFIVYNKDNSGEKEYGFNGTAIVTRKVAESKKLNLPGMMFWQLAGDLPVDHKKSLLNAMSAEFEK